MPSIQEMRRVMKQVKEGVKIPRVGRLVNVEVDDIGVLKNKNAVFDQAEVDKYKSRLDPTTQTRVQQFVDRVNRAGTVEDLAVAVEEETRDIGRRSGRRGPGGEIIPRRPDKPLYDVVVRLSGELYQKVGLKNKPENSEVFAINEQLRRQHKRVPRVSVYLGMLPELRRRMGAKGIVEKRIQVVIMGEEGEEVTTIPAFDAMDDPDQVVLAVLETLNMEMSVMTNRFSYRAKSVLDTGRMRLKTLVGEEDARYSDTITLVAACNDMQELTYDVWQEWRGSAKAPQEMLKEVGSKLGNGRLSMFFEDPFVERGFHEIKGLVDVENDFVKGNGAGYDLKNPVTGAVEKIVVQGKSVGAAEKVGHFLRWMTGAADYDGYDECKTNSYNAHKLKWFIEYSQGKGWYEGALDLIYETTETGEVIVHTPTAFPTLWHASNVMADVWVEYLKGTKADEDNLDWKDKARMMCRYAKRDLRTRRGFFTYTREEFENASEYDQMMMYLAARDVWGQIDDSEKKIVVQNNLLSDRWIMHDHRELNGDPNGIDVGSTFNPGTRTARFGVRPVIDLDSKKTDGTYRVCMADLFYANSNKPATTSNWMNNYYIYEGYATNTESFWEKLAPVDVASLREMMKSLFSAGNPNEAYRNLYGYFNKETGEREGMLERYSEETSWMMEAKSPLLYAGLHLDRMKGLRLEEVAVPTNEYVRLGLFKSFYVGEFDDVGLEGHDWTNLYENPIRSFSGRVAKILGKMDNRDVWLTYLGGIFDDTPFANLTDKQKFQALVAFAGFRIRQRDEDTGEDISDGLLELRERIEHDGKTLQEGRLVRHFKFDLDREREWGRQMFGANFETVMAVMNEKVQRSGLFNNFYEKMDEENIIGSLIDGYLENEYVADKQYQFKRRWGIRYSPTNREVFFNQLLRDSVKYSIGRLQGQYALEQLATVEENMGKSGLPNVRQQNEVQVQKVINGVNKVFTAKNIYMKEKEIGDPVTQRVVDRVLNPVFPLFHWSSAYGNGRDPVWSMLQGTGEFYPGMTERLTPLYIHYNKNRMINFLASLYFDPRFWRMVFKNSGKDWEDNFGFLYVCNPMKIRQFVKALETVEDIDWGQELARKFNVADQREIMEFDHERRELRVLDAETGKISQSVSEEDIMALKDLTLTAFKQVPAAGILSGIAGNVFGRTTRETRARFYGFLAGIPASSPVWVPLLATPFTALFSVPVMIIGGLVTSAYLGRDMGVNEKTGYENDQYGGFILGDIKKVWATQFGLMGDRIVARSFESIAEGRSAIWDDVVDLKRLIEFITLPKEKLEHYKPAGGR